MATEHQKKKELTKFPNAEEANQKEAPAVNGLPSAFDLTTPSVNTIRFNLIAFLVLVALPLALAMAGQGPDLFHPANELRLFNDDNPWAMFGFISGIMTILAAPGSVVLQLRSVRKQATTWSEALNEGLRYFWRFFGLIIVMAIILGVSLLLLIVPFFIVLPRIMLAPYFLIDRKLGIMDALKESNDHYKSYGGIWGVVGVFILIAFTSALPLIGGLVTNILAFLYGPALAVRYEQIKLTAQGEAPQTPIEKDPAVA